MIIKVKVANEQAVESWRFYDGVEGLHYSKYDREPACECVVSSEVQEIDHRDTRSLATAFVECCFYTETNGPVHMRSNLETYLMSDSGRTIERLI